MEKWKEKLLNWKTGIGMILAALGSWGLFGVEPGDEGIVTANWEIIISSASAIVGAVLAMIGVFKPKKEE